MSIKKAAYNLCKEIKLFPQINEIRNLFREITYTKNNVESYGIFGQIAKQQKMQFLSYLLLNERYEELSLKPELNLPRRLSDDDVKLFDGAHQFIFEITNSCIKSLQEECLPPLLSMSPYFNIEYKRQIKPIDVDTKYTEILTELFKTHKSIATINNSLPLVPNFQKISSVEWGSAIDNLIQRIYKSGLSNPPAKIVQFKHEVDKDTLQYHSFRILLAMASLKSSFLTLAQLLFQAFLCDKLISFDENNIFSYEGPNSNSIGNSVTVSVQPIGKEASLHPSDLIYLNIPDKHLPINDLVSIYSCSMNFSQEYGTNFTYGLQLVDDDLSFFPNLSD